MERAEVEKGTLPSGISYYLGLIGICENDYCFLLFSCYILNFCKIYRFFLKVLIHWKKSDTNAALK